MFLFLILGFAFLFNLIVNSPAKKIEYKIYNNGFEYDGMFFGWDEFNHFFFYEDNPNLIIITTKDSLPGRVYVYVEEANRSQIDEMLNRVADNYANDSSYAIKGLSSALEPVILVILGVSVGGIVLSVITPIYSLVGSFSQ